MATTIELWRSREGLGDANFTLLATIADGDPFGPYFDIDVASGRTYWYKARRFDSVLNDYSDFSPVVNATAPIEHGDSIVTTPNTPTGLGTKIGMAVEATYGTAVKSNLLLYRTKGSLDLERKKLKRNALMNSVSRLGPAAGTAKTEGHIDFEATPESLTNLLLPHLGAPVTTAQTVPAAYNQHVFSDTQAALPVTLCENRGGVIFVQPGVKAGKMNLKVDIGSDEVITVGYDYMALDQWRADTEAHVGLDTANYDPIPAWTAVDATVTLAGSLTADCKSVDLTTNKNLTERRALRGKMGAQTHYNRRSDNEMTLVLYFSTEAELLRYFGQAQNVVAPYAALKTILTLPIEVDITPALNGNGFSNELSIIATNADFTTVGQPVEGDDAIMQTVKCYLYKDTVTGTNLQFSINNGQTNSGLITPGTAITALPTASDMQ